MKKTALCFALVCFCVFALSAFAEDAVFPGQRTFGGSYDEVLHHAITLRNGDLLLVGSAESRDGHVTLRKRMKTPQDAYAVRLSASGDVVWYCVSDEPGPNDAFIHAAELPDGRIALLHQFEKNERILGKIEILEADGDRLEEIQTTSGARAFVADDKGVYTVGYRLTMNSDAKAVYDIIDVPYARRVNWKNSVLWEHQHKRAPIVSVQFQGVLAAGDGIFAYGFGILGDEYGYNGVAVRFTADGKTAWRYFPEQPYLSREVRAAPAPDGGFYLVGANTKVILVSRLNADGGLVFERRYPIETEQFSVPSLAAIETDEGLLVGAMLADYEVPADRYRNTTLHLLEISESGELIASSAAEKPTDRPFTLAGFVRGTDGTVYLYGTLYRLQESEFLIAQVALP